MTPGLKRGGAVLTLLAWLAGCESAPKPTTPSADVTALTLTKQPPFMRPGETFQLIATATLSNGQTTTNSSLVRWSTLDPAIAVVSTNGLVTAKADGRTIISASTDAIAASAEFVVRSGGQTVTGIVTESAPTTSVAVAGAQVTVTDGLYAGISATTDAQGSFVLPDVNGVLNLKISAPHFDDALLSADTAVSSGLTIRLLPTDRTVTDSAEGKSPGYKQLREGTLTFDMHRAGRVDFVPFGQHDYGDDTCFSTAIRASDNTLVFSKSWFVLDGSPVSPAAILSLEGGQRYKVTLTACQDYASLLWFKMSVTHPY
jgi:Bacterial Ig-like domain (group 2)